MKQSFAITLVIFALFGLWLFNTGRVTSFIDWLKTTPGQGTLPGQPKAKRTGTSSAAGVANTAACASAAAGGIVTPECVGTFVNELTDPIGTVKSAVSTLTFGVIHL